MPSRCPIITLTTDFGLADAYVAQMKAALLREAPEARLIDVTHLVPRHDVRFATFQLERAISAFDAGTVHLCVVDPGVGSGRRLLISEVSGQAIVCPDNGLITWPLRRHQPRRGSIQHHELTWRSKQPSDTFHGRDILAPAAGMIAAGESPARLGQPVDDPFLLDMKLATLPLSHATVLHIDHYGNVITDIPRELEDDMVQSRLLVNDTVIGPAVRTYADADVGAALLLYGSAGLLEIAVREGSAAHRLGLKVGHRLEIIR